MSATTTTLDLTLPAAFEGALRLAFGCDDLDGQAARELLEAARRLTRLEPLPVLPVGMLAEKRAVLELDIQKFHSGPKADADKLATAEHDLRAGDALNRQRQARVQVWLSRFLSSAQAETLAACLQPKVTYMSLMPLPNGDGTFYAETVDS